MGDFIKGVLSGIGLGVLVVGVIYLYLRKNKQNRRTK
jgi:hypothetical protein